MRRERKELNHKAEELYTEVKSIIDTFAENHPLPERTIEEVNAVKRAWVNTSVILALSSTLRTTGEKAVDLLAEKTHGLEGDDELRAALAEGSKLAGENFQRAVIHVLKASLSAYD